MAVFFESPADDDVSGVSLFAEARPRRVRARGANATSVVYDAVRAGIRNGSYLPTSTISEESLMRALAVTRTSVRDALAQLTTEGVITRSPRRGTAPVARTVHVTADDALSLDAAGDEVTSRIVEVPKSRHVFVADRIIGVKLGLAEDEQVRVDESVLTVDGEPAGVRTTYTSMSMLPAESSHPHGIGVRERLASLGVVVTRTESTFEAISADRETAAKLRLPINAPVLLREVLYFADLGRPILMSVVRHRSDRVIVHTATRRE
jgi:GntR family transcriptional regulator